MAEEVSAGYGYSSDERKENPFDFGLNAGVTFLKSFGYIPNGGKDGADQDALEIIFEINGVEKSYRKFPVTKAYLKTKKGEPQQETTDPKHKAFIEAVDDLNSSVVHILRAFVDNMTIEAALAKKIASFKDFCNITAGLLPAKYDEVALDIFLGYQWQMSTGRDKTYLDIPTKVKQGKWLCKEVPGIWEERKVPNPQEKTREALYYIKVDKEGKPVLDSEGKEIKHPFIRNGWYMLSNYANQQYDPNAAGVSAQAEAQGAAAQNGPAANAEAGAAVKW